MTKHIVIIESDEPIELRDIDGFIELHDAMKEMADAWRAKAESDYGPADWGVLRWLENACYDLWGPVGELAKANGLLG